MIESDWLTALRLPFWCGLLPLVLFALPNVFWELGQWRIAHLGRPLPSDRYARVVAPALFAIALYSALVFGCGFVAPRIHIAQTYPPMALILGTSLGGIVVYLLARLIMWRVLRMPFALPGEGTGPQLHCSVEASGSDSKRS